MFKSAIFLGLLAVCVAARQCICDDDDSTSAVRSNDVLKNLRLNLGLPSAYNAEFVRNTQSFIGQFVLLISRMRELRVDRTYIDEMEGYQNGFVDKINNFGSLSKRSSFVDKITDYSGYLETQSDKINRYTDTFNNNEVLFYFFTILANLESTRSFHDSSLNNVDCIFYDDQGTGKNPKPKPKPKPKHSKERDESDEDDRSDF